MSELTFSSSSCPFFVILSCSHATCSQGFTIEGEAFIDTVGISKEIFLFVSPSITRPPYWDHNLFKVDMVNVGPNATSFAVVRSRPNGIALPCHTYLIPQALFPLPPGGKLLDTSTWDSVVSVNNVGGFVDGQLDYSLAS